MDPVDVVVANTYTDSRIASGGGGGGVAGVSSFKGRTGAVTPATGDYTADMVGADASGSATAARQAANLYTDAQITAAIGALSIPAKTSQLQNDSGFATTSDVNAGLEAKVSKESGKVLSTNDYTTAEKEKLAALQNYNDTEVKQLIDGKVDKEAGKGLSTNDYTTEEKQRLATLQNYDDTQINQQIEGKVDKVEGMGLSHNDLTDEMVAKIEAVGKSMQLKTRVDTEADLPPDPAVGDTYFVGLEGASEFEQYTYTEGGWLNTGTTSADLAKYLLKDEATALLAGKVDKVEGKGLSTNDYTTAEKEKLDKLTNYDDTAIREQIGKKVDAVVGKGLSTNDYTTDEKEKLSRLSNYDDTSIRELLADKVDAIEGKGLSTNDYTDEEKAKVAATASIDDTTTSADKVWSSSKVDTAKLTKANNVSMTGLGFTKGDTVSVLDFLSALVAKYGRSGYCNMLWANANSAEVTDGTTTVLINGGVLFFAATDERFPNASWQYAEAIYCPTETGIGDMYKFVARIGDTAGTTNVARIYRYTGQTTADVVSATIAYNTATAVATTDGEASTYSVRNGACYVSMDFTAQTTTDATVKLADAPRPSQTINSPAAMFDGSGVDAIVKIYATGLHVAKITSGKRYICSFSYPVA